MASSRERARGAVHGSPGGFHRPRGSRWAAAWLGLGALLQGCHVVEADIYNLDQLHHPDDEHKLAAALQSNVLFALRSGLAALAPRTKLGQPGKPEEVESAPDECLERLISLDSYEPSDPRVRARQVEWFARLAVGDPWSLSRERAVIGLGRAGARLGRVTVAKLAAEQDPGGPAVVSEALSALTEAVTAAAERSGSSAARAVDLQSACDLIALQVLDVDGARRALFVVSELAARAGLSADEQEPLLALADELERRLVGQALARALEDESPRVRAAAVGAALRAESDAPLFAALARLNGEDRHFAKTVLDLVREYGLPMGAEREAALGRVYAQVFRPDAGEVRVSAMRALAAVTDAGLTSLREEDWQAWWDARAPRGSGAP